MKYLRICVVILCLALGASFTGCGGGGAKVQTQTRQATVGQELIDLEKAYKDGIITQKEYETQKKRILSGK